MKYGLLFSLVAVLLSYYAATQRGWLLLLVWMALSFAIVASGYFHFGPRVFGKSSFGVLSPINQILLLPFLICLWSVWHAARLARREPAFHQLTDHIYIGRRLLCHEFPGNFDHVIDLTCEFHEPRALRSGSYHSFQILDAYMPSPAQLRQWVEQAARLTGTIYIHCAEGRGRTGLFAAALLLHNGHSRTVADALQFITSKRPMVRLGRLQLALLRTLYND